MKHLNKINLLRMIIMLTGCSIDYSDHYNLESYSTPQEEFNQFISTDYVYGDIRNEIN